MKAKLKSAKEHKNEILEYWKLLNVLSNKDNFIITNVLSKPLDKY